MSAPRSLADSWPDTLVQAYRAARFDILLDSGTVSLSSAGVVEGNGGRIGERLAVVTAWNPGVSRPGRAANERANARLEARLEREGRRYLPAIGRSADHAHAEPSFAVLGLTTEEARALAEDFGQAAVFCWDGCSAELVWCERRPARTAGFNPPREAD